jgi:hypothetical protein
MATPLRLLAQLLPAAVLGLGACSNEPDLPPGVELKDGKASAAGLGQRQVARDEKGVTPLAERVATIGLLNKRNNLTRDLRLKPGEAQRVDNVIVKLAACERTAPWEDPPETGAFVQVFVEERATVREPLAWRKVFSGWLFKNAPSLNVVEHPVYDVWVKDCAMRFPGEEAAPRSDSADKAAKPAGRPSAAPPATASPLPTPTPEALPPAPSPSPVTA